MVIVDLHLVEEIEKISLKFIGLYILLTFMLSSQPHLVIATTMSQRSRIS